MNKLFEAVDNLKSLTLNLTELDTWVDPRSKTSGWKVKVLDVIPDEYAGSTVAKVELIDPNGESQGEDTIYIHRQKVKIGETYDAYIDGIMAMPRIKGVPDFTLDEVPDMRKVTRDLYEDESNNANYSLNDDDPDDVYISCNINSYGDSLLCIIPCLYDEESNIYKVSKDDINFMDDEGKETYPDIDYDEIINNIPKDILDELNENSLNEDEEDKVIFNNEEILKVAEELGIDFSKFSVEDFTTGINIELEHGTINPETNVTNDDLLMTAKIALAHLNEYSDYYNQEYGLPAFERQLEERKSKLN